MKKAALFVDGENLVYRFQSMVRNEGRRVLDGVVHEQDRFVWTPTVTKSGFLAVMDVIRVTYYTHLVGNHDEVPQLERRIAATTFAWRISNASGWKQLQARVHKKPQHSHKTKVCDVDITIDVMKALGTNIDVICLLSGDGDFLQLAREVTRNTDKEMYIGAFSSGLADSLRSNAEQFIDLDALFFHPA